MKNNIDGIDLEKQWHKIFPSLLSGLFAFYECICSIGIIGCELGSILIDKFNSTIYVGFWSSLFLITAWISQGLAVSRCRTRQCATYTLILKCISLFFAICIIGFDAYFLIYPNTCFYTLSLCNSTASSRGIFYSKDNFDEIKMSLIKAQLAFGAAMFALDIAYIIMYIVTRMRLKTDKQLKITSSNENKNVVESLSPSATNADVTANSEEKKSMVPTKITDLDVIDVDENVTESLPTSTGDHSAKNVLLTETTYIVTTNEEVTKPLPPTITKTNVSTKNSVTKNVVSTKKTHTVTKNRNVNKPLPPSNRNSNVSTKNHITKSVVSIQNAHGLTKQKSIVKIASPPITHMNTPTENPITENIVSTTTTETHAWDIDENTKESLPLASTDANILTKTTDLNVINIEENIIKSFSPSTRTTPAHVWDIDEDVVKSLSTPNTDMNVFNTTNSSMLKSIDKDISITDEKIIKSSSLPNTNTAVQTSSIESLYHSRWSITSDDLV